MAISGSQKAYTFARSGIARSGATRSNYVLPWSTVDLIVRDEAGNVISRTDIAAYIRAGSLSITQALNDEADTCSFTIVPTAPASAVPAVGAEIAIAWTPGQVLFQGYALVVQADRRVRNESPWVSVQCQDSMWRFDARIVTHRFPAQSVTTSIAFLVRHFCNRHHTTPNPLDFRTTFVEAGMPSIAGFDVVNQRPSTVMRTLMAAVGGAFYVEGLDLHAWAGSLNEPNQPNPEPLTNDRSTLKTFRLTTDATQIRRGVIVEGRRTQTLAGVPAVDALANPPIGLPLTDASFMDAALGIDMQHVVRFGTQWVQLQNPIALQLPNPPQTRVAVAFAVGNPTLRCEALTPPPPLQGWIRVGGQLAAYQGSNTAGGFLDLVLASTVHGYGWLTVPIAVGETVEWVDGVMEDYALAYNRSDPAPFTSVVGAQPPDTPIVLIGEAYLGPSAWPQIEAFVQDGRYSYAGATARAQAELAAFADPLVTADWTTDDLHAAPGRLQVVNLTGASAVSLTVTITRVELSFPLRTLPPRRRCAGGDVKPATFLDLVLTDES